MQNASHYGNILTSTQYVIAIAVARCTHCTQSVSACSSMLYAVSETASRNKRAVFSIAKSAMCLLLFDFYSTSKCSCDYQEIFKRTNAITFSTFNRKIHLMAHNKCKRKRKRKYKQKPKQKPKTAIAYRGWHFVEIWTKP